jgi:hypothetical protein
MNVVIHHGEKEGARDGARMIEYLERENREVGEVVEKRDAEGMLISREVIDSIRRESIGREESGLLHGRSVQVLRDAETGATRSVEYYTAWDGTFGNDALSRAAFLATLDRIREDTGIEDPLYHGSINLTAKDVATPEELLGLARAGCDKVGIPRMRLYSVHFDTPNPHVHFLGLRARYDAEAGKWKAIDFTKLDRGGDYRIWNGPEGFCRQAEIEHNALHPDRPWQISPGIGDPVQAKRFRGYLNEQVAPALERAIAAQGDKPEVIHEVAARYGVRVHLVGATGLRWENVGSKVSAKGSRAGLAEVLSRRGLEEQIGVPLAPATELRHTFSASGVRTFAEYVAGNSTDRDENVRRNVDARAARIGQELRAAARSGGAELQGAARAHGLGIVREQNGGWSIRDLQAADDPKRRVKASTVGLRGLAKLDIPPPQIITATAKPEMTYEQWDTERRARERECSGEELVKNPQRFIDDLFEKNATVSSADVRRALLEQVATTAQYDRVLNHLENLHANGDLICLRNEIPSEDPDAETEYETRWTTREQLEREATIRDTIVALRDGEQNPAITVSAERLERYSFRDEQRKFVEEVLAGKKLVVARGHAGTGKSYAMKGIVDILEERGIKCIVIAQGGQAVEEVKKATGASEAYTIEALRRGVERGGVQVAGAQIILDEGNMAGDVDTLEALEFVHRHGARGLAAAGDDKQLPAVAAGGAFRTLLENVDVVDIGEVLRYDGWRLTAATALREPRSVRKALDLHIEHGQHHLLDTRDEVLERIVNAWDMAPQAVEDKGIFAFRNEDVGDLNGMIEERLSARGELRDHVRMKTSVGTDRESEIRVAVGTRIIFEKNDRRKELDVRNGTRGTVVGITFDPKNAATLELAVKLDGKEGREIRFTPQKYDRIDYGWACTTFKAEGITLGSNTRKGWSATYLSRADYMQAAYVSDTRSTGESHWFCSKEDLRFNYRRNPNRPQDYEWNLTQLLKRQRVKDRASDYERESRELPIVAEDQIVRDRDALYVIRARELTVGREDVYAERAETVQEETKRRVDAAHEQHMAERAGARTWVKSENAQAMSREERLAEKELRYAKAADDYRVTIAEVRKIAGIVAVRAAFDRAADVAATQRAAVADTLRDVRLERRARGGYIVRNAAGDVLFTQDARGKIQTKSSDGFDAALLYMQQRYGGVTFSGDLDTAANRVALERTVQLDVTVKNPELASAVRDVRRDFELLHAIAVEADVDRLGKNVSAAMVESVALPTRTADPLRVETDRRNLGVSVRAQPHKPEASGAARVDHTIEPGTLRVTSPGGTAWGASGNRAAYVQALKASTLRYAWNIEQTKTGVLLRGADGDIHDAGKEITVRSEEAIAARGAVALAVLKGWSNINVDGGTDAVFRAVAVEAHECGVGVCVDDRKLTSAEIASYSETHSQEIKQNPKW